MLVTVDVRNAFISLKWGIIICLIKAESEKLRELLVRLNSYLSERRVTTETTEEMETVAVYTGVLQGSIICPILWNVAYDPLLRLELQLGVTSLGYADEHMQISTN